ncbi:MAG: type II toxin-antitoxin system VapC family toxin [Acidobacteriaceae bacterium]|nr:type II toxin-antitoxin system VapC family toxin [Acidobacteriaceae bacterium]
MIAVDTSILVAVISAEPDALALIEHLSNNDICLPASVLVEAAILATNRGLRRDLDLLLESLSALIIPLDEAIARLAQDAHERYGKGRHKASLNFGDCLVYATAKYLSLPLFYKGNDFRHTDCLSFLPK